MRYLYSRWDGSDEFELDRDSLMDELTRHLMEDGDVSYALWKMRNWGLENSGTGRQLSGLQDLIQRLKQKRQEQLEKYRLNSIMDGIREKLDDIVKTEREGIRKRLDQSAEKPPQATDIDPKMLADLEKLARDVAQKHLEKLERLPESPSAKFQQLSKYDFMDGEAERKFKELKDSLTKNALESYLQDLVQKLKGMNSGDISAMRHMLHDLNRMLEQQKRGETPDFNAFMQKYGQNFGPNPPQNLEELLQMFQDQVAQAQALFNSLSPEQRKELENLLDSMLDEATKEELSRFAFNLNSMNPSQKGQPRYAFSGEEEVTFEQALKLMEHFQKMDRLDEQLKNSQYSHDLGGIDRKLMRDLLGDSADKQLDAIEDMSKLLEDAGYIRQNNNRYELTPKGMRKVGQRAVKDIFSQLRKDQIGNHSTSKAGFGLERLEETRKYEFGDPLNLHLEKTLMNALKREAQTPPIKLSTEDFEVFKTEQLTQTATVLMLDLSLSMPMYHNFEAAKRVAVALDELIRTQFPQDRLFLLGFSTYARLLKKEELLRINWNDLDPYTNIQHGLFMARKLLSREWCSNKNVILVSDGEPTAHCEQGTIYVRYPPSPRTIAKTLEEVKICTQKGIVVNTFMLKTREYQGYFVNKMAEMNKGRVFFTDSQNLGAYILKDYITGRRKKV